MPARTMRRHRIAVLAIAAAVLAGCNGSNGGLSSTSSLPGNQPPPTSTDLHYGAAPQPNGGAVYQPDVVIVGGGGGSVRGVTDGGLTWRLDSQAKGMSELAVGRIMFVTGRGVGRVVDKHREGADTVVTIVPVPFTDVIKKGRFAGTAPVSLSNPLAYDAGQPFWAGPTTPSEPAPSGGTPSWRQSALLAPTVPVPHSGGSASAEVSGLKLAATCCAGGAGASFSYDDGPLTVTGKAVLQLAKPTASFDLVIDGGSVKSARLQLKGGIGIRVEFDAQTHLRRNIDKVVQIPVDFAVPFANILGVPLSASINQLVAVQTRFTAKDGNLHAVGEWSIGGGLGFSYANGGFHVNAPKALPVKTSILDSLQGISVGVSGMSLSYQTRLTVGIGAFGFIAGLFFLFTVHVSLNRGSALGSPITVCNSAQLDLFASYGIGYSIPRAVAKLVNFFLRKFGSRPIEAHGGLESSTVSFTKIAFDPDTKICRK